MLVNVKVRGGLNIEWGQIDPKATGGLNTPLQVKVLHSNLQYRRVMSNAPQVSEWVDILPCLWCHRHLSPILLIRLGVVVIARWRRPDSRPSRLFFLGFLGFTASQQTGRNHCLAKTWPSALFFPSRSTQLFPSGTFGTLSYSEQFAQVDALQISRCGFQMYSRSLCRPLRGKTSRNPQQQPSGVMKRVSDSCFHIYIFLNEPSVFFRTIGSRLHDDKRNIFFTRRAGTSVLSPVADEAKVRARVWRCARRKQKVLSKCCDASLWEAYKGVCWCACVSPEGSGYRIESPLTCS